MMPVASDRAQIPFSFSYPSGSTYGSSSATTYTGVAVDSIEPVVGTSVTVVDRDTNGPATVYLAERGSGTYTTLITDAQGSVPGWVGAGSYRLTAASQGGFGGAVVNFEAARGDGVTRIAPGAVIQPAFALGSVDMPQLSPAVQALLNSLAGIPEEVEDLLEFASANVPVGTVMYWPVTQSAYNAGVYIAVIGGVAQPPVWLPGIMPVPTGFLPVIGQLLAITTYPALYAAKLLQMSPGYNFNNTIHSQPPTGYFYLDPLYVSSLSFSGSGVYALPIIKY